MDLAWRRLRRNYFALRVPRPLRPHRRRLRRSRRSTRATSRIPGRTTTTSASTFTRNGKQVQHRLGRRLRRTGKLRRRLAIPIGPHAGSAPAASMSSAPTSWAATSRCGCSTAASTRSWSGSARRSICTFFAIVLALLAGYFGGWVDCVISRFFDLIWAFPVVLLGDRARHRARRSTASTISASTSRRGSLWIPTLVISYVLIPYIGRPLRGQILSLREKEFVEAATAQGASAAAGDVQRAPAEHRVARCSSSSR